jgi:hypothetical protein
VLTLFTAQIDTPFWIVKLWCVTACLRSLGEKSPQILEFVDARVNTIMHHVSGVRQGQQDMVYSDGFARAHVLVIARGARWDIFSESSGAIKHRRLYGRRNSMGCSDMSQG